MIRHGRRTGVGASNWLGRSVGRRILGQVVVHLGRGRITAQRQLSRHVHVWGFKLNGDDCQMSSGREGEGGGWTGDDDDATWQFCIKVAM